MKYMLPGMGANSRMFSGPWHEIEDCRFIDWPAYHHEKSIADLARRIIREFDITPEDIAGGASMGGMVALEIARILGLKEVFLIGSATHAGEISLLGRAAMPLAGRPVVRISQWMAPWSSDDVQQMYAASNTEFIVSMSKAVRHWQGFSGDHRIIRRIHGRKDPFISCPDNCEIIEKGGHLIAITHARACVDFINRC